MMSLKYKLIDFLNDFKSDEMLDRTKFLPHVYAIEEFDKTDEFSTSLLTIYSTQIEKHSNYKAHKSIQGKIPDTIPFEYGMKHIRPYEQYQLNDYKDKNQEYLTAKGFKSMFYPPRLKTCKFNCYCEGFGDNHPRFGCKNKNCIGGMEYLKQLTRIFCRGDYRKIIFGKKFKIIFKQQYIHLKSDRKNILFQTYMHHSCSGNPFGIDWELYALNDPQEILRLWVDDKKSFSVGSLNKEFFSNRLQLFEVKQK